jgi:hypothetical protein
MDGDILYLMVVPAGLTANHILLVTVLFSVRTSPHTSFQKVTCTVVLGNTLSSATRVSDGAPDS